MDKPGLSWQHQVMGVFSSAADRRVSADEREHLVALLQDAHVDERLSPHTFAERIERLYLARTEGELRALVADLSQPGRVARWLEGLAGWAAACTSRCADAWAAAKAPVLVLPSEGVVLLGRSRKCECVIPDPTVSRRHATLRRIGDGWELRDICSLNGTYVNGRRITEALTVRAGDGVSFGSARFRLAELRRDSR